MTWGLVASAGVTIVGGAIASDSAGDAADAQAASAGKSIDEQRRQFDATQANLQPFQEAGEAALQQQRILLGLGGTDPNAALRSDLEAQLANIDQQGGGSTDKGVLGAAFGASRGSSDRRADIQSQLDNLPEFNAGTSVQQQQGAFDALNQSPGQQFLRDRAQKNLLRNSSAIGGLGGGNVRSALVQQGVGFAQQDLQNQFGRLGQLAGQGQSAATNIGQFGQQTAANIGNSLTAQGNARATGIQNQNNAIQQGISGVTTAFGQSGMFGNPNAALQSNPTRNNLSLGGIT